MEEICYKVGSKCRGCGACIRICPVGAIQKEHGYASISSELCTGCGKCINRCYFGAIYISLTSEDSHGT